ncbi:MAG: glycosyltransferase family 4 protein, partial [Nitrospirota bacterium]
MKKVLIIAHSFPPSTSSGARRPFGLVKYLPKFGWEPIVLTPKLLGRSLGEMRIIETDYKDVIGSLKSKLGFNPQKGLQEQFGMTISKNYNHKTLKSRIIKLLKEIITFPDDKKGWYNFALKNACEFLSGEKIDVIISTSPPVITHLIARELKRQYNIPWIADFRDLWSQDTLYIEKSKVRRYLERRLELSTLKNSDAIIAVSESYAEQLKILHSSLKEKTYVVTNGFDPDDFRALHKGKSDKFVITHTGSLHGDGRDPSPLFASIQKLMDENKIDPGKFEIRFYGPDNFPTLLAEKYGLNNVVKTYGSVSHHQCIENQINSTVLLIVERASEENWMTYPVKIFEYLGARRPILAVASEKGTISDLLIQTMAGFATLNTYKIRDIIKNWYAQFIIHGEVKFTGIDS